MASLPLPSLPPLREPNDSKLKVLSDRASVFDDSGSGTCIAVYFVLNLRGNTYYNRQDNSTHTVAHLEFLNRLVRPLISKMYNCEVLEGFRDSASAWPDAART